MNAPLVVGYRGEIGSFILQGLLKVMPKASDIWCVDINDSDDEVKERINKSDVIFLCVPIQETRNWIYRWTTDRSVKLEDKLIIEQTSLKCNIFEEFSYLKILSMHILFRPSKTPNSTDRRIAFVTNSQFDVELVGEILHMTDSSLIEYATIQEHDRDMALIQALTHRILLTLERVQQSSIGSTYISGQVFDLADRIRQGDRTLYKIIQSNPHLKDIIKKFNQELDNFETWNATSND